MKRGILLGISAMLLLASLGVLIWGLCNKRELFKEAYSDGVEQVDLDTIYLGDSDVTVDFSEVLLGKQYETRQLIVTTQQATVSTELSESLIGKLDFDFLKKSQRVSYTGQGHFVVDLDQLTKECIIDDKEKKIITIKIPHAYLKTIEIDPNKIIVFAVQESLFARGNIELSVGDYKEIEKELVNRMREKFNTSEQGQIADATALRMVKEVYEPVVKAIDKEYSVVVEFK